MFSNVLKITIQISKNKSKIEFIFILGASGGGIAHIKPADFPGQAHKEKTPKRRQIMGEHFQIKMAFKLNETF
jgi:hypothetical protein